MPKSKPDPYKSEAFVKQAKAVHSAPPVPKKKVKRAAKKKAKR